MIRLAGLLLTPLLVACAAGSGSPSAPQRVVPSPQPVPSDAAPSDESDGLPAGMVDDVIALAERETGVDRAEIEVTLAEAVTWSDGSIGCPEEGNVYTQALVPGYRVILDIAGEELAFHASEAGEFSPCRSPIQPVEGSPDS